jgi:hypothetical protein
MSLSNTIWPIYGPGADLEIFVRLSILFLADIRGGGGGKWARIYFLSTGVVSYSLFARQPTRLYCHDIVVSRHCLEFCFTHRHVLLINKLLTFLSAKRHILLRQRLRQSSLDPVFHASYPLATILTCVILDICFPRVEVRF